MLHTKIRKFSHSGDMGDIIYSLPVIKRFRKGVFYISPSMIPISHELEKKGHKLDLIKRDGTDAGISKEKFLFLKPLLEKQKYISELKYDFCEEDDRLSLDDFRLHFECGNIFERYIKAFSSSADFYNSPWIEVIPNRVSEVLIARSVRYQNDKFPWEKICADFPNAVFVGLKEEHELFARDFCHIPFYKTTNALELASVIAGSDLFIGNQSLPYSIAEALKKTSIQESCPDCHDCMFVRDNATFFLEDFQK